jgi:hypothetical protein
MREKTMTAFEREVHLEKELRNLRDMCISGAEIGSWSKQKRVWVAEELQRILSEIREWRIEELEQM